MTTTKRRTTTALDATRNRIAIGIAAGIGVLLIGLLGSIWSNARLTHARWAEAQATQVARAISIYGSLLQAEAESVATRSAANDPQVSFPALESIQFIALRPLGIADPSFEQGPLRNNIETRLVGRAFNGETTQAEAYRDGEHWTIIAAARRAGDDAQGAVLLRADLAQLLRRHGVLQGQAGAFSLWARGAENYLRFVAGDHGGAEPRNTPRYLAETTIRPLWAGFEPESASSPPTMVASIIIALAGLGVGAALLVLLVAAFRQLHTLITTDAARLRELVQHQRSVTAALPQLTVTELAELGETLLEIVHRSNGTADEPAPPTPVSVPSLERDSAATRIGARTITGEAPDTDTDLVLDPIEVPEEIFRDYDIRGRAVQIDPALAHAIGRAVGSEALDRGCTAIVIGVDGRDSSPGLREMLVKGLLATGIDVIDIGVVATPMLYFACHHLRTPSGVMVTGSHNPADHNGFKVMIDGETLRGTGIGALRERIIANRFRLGQGSYRITGIDTDYIHAVMDDVLVDSNPKIVVDCGNGAAAVIAEDLFRELGCDVVPLYCTLDGRFPHHHPDPAEPENLRDLVTAVGEHGALLGIAFDGDGDRIGVVSGNGAIVTADRLLMLLARELLSRHPGADVVFDVKCSRDLPAVIAQNGGRPVMCRSGHSWIKEKMKETGALLGGEFTGHICFRDRWYGFDDALYCAARLLEIVSAEARSLDELLAELPQSIATPELRIPIAEEEKFHAMDMVSVGITLDNARISRIDGVRAEFPDGWGLVRASNTSAALTLRFEAQDTESLERLRALFRGELRRLLPTLDLNF